MSKFLTNWHEIGEDAILPIVWRAFQERNGGIDAIVFSLSHPAAGRIWSYTSQNYDLGIPALPLSS